MATVWALAVVGLLLPGLPQMLIYRSDRAHDLQQADLQAKGEKDQQQLQEKLDSSLQEDVRKELDGIVRFLQTPQPRMDTRHLADAASKMVEDAMHR